MAGKRRAEEKEWVGAMEVTVNNKPAAGEKLGHYLTVKISGRVGRLCSGIRPGPGMFWLVFFFFSSWQRVQGKGVLSRLF
jgi:hypothetical protein